MYALILTFIATLTPDTPTDRDDPVDDPIEDQHFCCAETYNDSSGKHGNDCETIDKADVKACTIAGGAVLYCNGSWDLNTSGTATC